LLVSNRDVENYNQVDKDLFILKQLTEKSELWVHYGKQAVEGSSTTSCSSPSNPSQDRSDDDFLHESVLGDKRREERRNIENGIFASELIIMTLM
jgi:hypothetical protein